MDQRELNLQADTLIIYLSKFPKEQHREQLLHWMESKDFQAKDAAEIVLIAFVDRMKG